MCKSYQHTLRGLVLLPSVAACNSLQFVRLALTPLLPSTPARNAPETSPSRGQLFGPLLMRYISTLALFMPGRCTSMRPATLPLLEARPARLAYQRKDALSVPNAN